MACITYRNLPLIQYYVQYYVTSWLEIKLFCFPNENVMPFWSLRLRPILNASTASHFELPWERNYQIIYRITYLAEFGGSNIGRWVWLWEIDRHDEVQIETGVNTRAMSRFDQNPPLSLLFSYFFLNKEDELKYRRVCFLISHCLAQYSTDTTH